VSYLTWSLFGIANIGLYIYTEKYTALPSILGLLGSAALDFIIAALALVKYGSPMAEEP
jgi:polyferredoxin